MFPSQDEGTIFPREMRHPIELEVHIRGVGV